MTVTNAALNEFQSTPSGGKATRALFIFRKQEKFQSTPSGGKATRYATSTTPPRMFQSTPSGGKATSFLLASNTPFQIVSIHAFRGEGDGQGPQGVPRSDCFNPRLPGGRRLRMTSTPPAPMNCFNPRLPGGRRLGRGNVWSAIVIVSIHAFRGEGDQSDEASIIAKILFQSTPSGGKATSIPLIPVCPSHVSIHAFRGEGDGSNSSLRRSSPCFNPRLPGGRRPSTITAPTASSGFNPRLPGGRRIAVRSHILSMTVTPWGTPGLSKLTA